MHKKLRTLLTAAVLGLTAATATIDTHGAAHANAAAAPIETTPIWRLQLRIVTGDSPTAGTNGIPAVRLNSTNQGVRTLNPSNSTAFDRAHVDTYDLRLLDRASQITMLRIGIAGNDDWCVKQVTLILNNRVAFDRNVVPGGACATIRAGTYVEYSSTDLRTNPSWVNYGTPPPLPTRLTATDLRAIVANVTGSAMTATAGVSWNPATPLTLTRTTSRTIRVAYGIRIVDPSGIESPFTATITYTLELHVGVDDKLHVRKQNPSCCYHYTMSDAVVAHLDTALTRMTSKPVPHDPLSIGVDAATNINWSYHPVITEP
jgi:hypothetical protein